MRTMAKKVFAVFMVLGITSSIGAVSNGNNPTMSITLAIVALTALVILNWRSKSE